MEVYKKITNGILVTVRSRFLEEESSIEESQYYHAYEISIQNRSDETVQLLTRHWEIFDSIMGYRDVDGAGVVGEQPVLAPGEHFKYVSLCPLQSTFGTMSGFYTFKRLSDEAAIEVIIPEFDLIFPAVLN